MSNDETFQSHVTHLNIKLQKQFKNFALYVNPEYVNRVHGYLRYRSKQGTRKYYKEVRFIIDRTSMLLIVLEDDFNKYSDYEITFDLLKHEPDKICQALVDYVRGDSLSIRPAHIKGVGPHSDFILRMYGDLRGFNYDRTGRYKGRYKVLYPTK